MQRTKRYAWAAAIAVLVALIAPGGASARGGGGHGGAQAGSNKPATSASTPRAQISGLPSGKRMHKPYTLTAKSVTATGKRVHKPLR